MNVERNKEIRISREGFARVMDSQGIVSFRELARRCGMTSSPIYAIRDSGRVSWATLKRIADALDVDPQELAEDDVSLYGVCTISWLDRDAVYRIVAAIVKSTMTDYMAAYRAVLKGKDPLHTHEYDMRDCMRAIREWLPDHADAIEEHMRKEVEREKRKKVFGRDPDDATTR